MRSNCGQKELPVTTEKKLFDTDVPLKSVTYPVASNLEDSCAEPVGSNDDNIASIEIIDLTSEQVESNTQFSLNTSENVYFNIDPSSTCDVNTKMSNLSSREVEKYASISPYDTDGEEITGDITYVGKRKYVYDFVYDDVRPVTCGFVPDDINGTTLYIVPFQASGNMNNCKGTRPWGYGQTSKSKSLTKGPRLLCNCRGSYCCTNVKCDNITDFEINRLEFQQKEGVMISSLYGEETAYLLYRGRLILEKDTEKKIITAKHYGTQNSQGIPSFNLRRHGKTESVTAARAIIIFCCCYYNCKKLHRQNIY